VDGLDSSLAQSPGKLWPNKCETNIWAFAVVKGLKAAQKSKNLICFFEKVLPSTRIYFLEKDKTYIP